MGKKKGRGGGGTKTAGFQATIRKRRDETTLCSVPHWNKTGGKRVFGHWGRKGRSVSVQLALIQWARNKKRGGEKPGSRLAVEKGRRRCHFI